MGMAFAVFGMRLLETIFFIGVAGSAVVVVLSFVEDIQELFGADEAPHAHTTGTQ